MIGSLLHISFCIVLTFPCCGEHRQDWMSSWHSRKHNNHNTSSFWPSGIRPIKYLVKKIVLLLKEYLCFCDIEEATSNQMPQGFRSSSFPPRVGVWGPGDGARIFARKDWEGHVQAAPVAVLQLRDHHRAGASSASTTRWLTSALTCPILLISLVWKVIMAGSICNTQLTHHLNKPLQTPLSQSGRPQGIASLPATFWSTQVDHCHCQECRLRCF